MEVSSFGFFRSLRSKPGYQNLTKPIFICDHLRTPENMGAVLRIAGNIGALKTIFISDKAHTFKNYKINRTASGGSEKTEWVIINDISRLKEQIPDDYHLIAVETADNAKSIFNYNFPEKVALILGNEMTGISAELMKMTTESVFIPVPGPVSSLNVTHALSIAAFEWLKQNFPLI